MRQVIIRAIPVVAVLVLMLSACGGEYDDAISVNDKFVNAVEAYVSDMESAGDADAVSAAMNDFADQVEKIMPEMKKIAEKYPELKDPDQIPEALKESQARAEAVGMKMVGQMMKAVTYMRDDGVKAAQERLQKAMVDMGQ